MHFSSVPTLQRLPPEIWDQIASFIPRYFLCTWLFISSFYRDIALCRIFRTVDLYLCEDSDNWNRTLRRLEECLHQLWLCCPDTILRWISFPCAPILLHSAAASISASCCVLNYSQANYPASHANLR